MSRWLGSTPTTSRATPTHYDFDAAHAALSAGLPVTESHPWCDSSGAPVGCIERFELNDLLPAGSTAAEKVVAVSQLWIDPDGSKVWFADNVSTAGIIGVYDIASGRARTFPVPDPARWASSIWRVWPWQIRVDAHSVYFTSYADGSIVRLRKADVDADLATPNDDCGTLVAGANPCMDVIHVPGPTERVLTHGIELSPDGSQLWFASSSAGYARARPDNDSVLIGTIDTATFTQVQTYSGLMDFQPSRNARNRSGGLAGISIDPATGRIAIVGILEVFVLDPR